MSNNLRAAILGTAPSWRSCPFDDPGLRITSLNDSYTMGVPRIDEHYELHPLDQMWFRPKDKKVFREGEVPKSRYIRPEGHLEWLKAQAATIPIWLKEAPPEDWPVNAQRFPMEALAAKYGSYWASGPSYMLMHLYDRGYRDLSIYGIHLSTHQEYQEQRGNLEFLCGRLLGAEVSERVTKGVRIYEGKDCIIRLPAVAPILTHAWKYAYEPRPVAPDAAAKARLAQAQHEYSTIAAQLVAWPRWKSKRRELTRLHELTALIRDAKMQARHAVISAGVA